MSYRKVALEAYEPICANCGFGIKAILEIAHIDGDRQNNNVDNLVILCPTCHKMLDVDLISNEHIKAIRNRARKVNWKKRMKDAGQKAARTRKLREAGRKAAETRKLKTKNEKVVLSKS